MERIILHVDVNNAFLSWTAVDLLKHGFNKDIRKIPSVIAGDPKKRLGIILAKSPCAKEYNIVTGETLYSARKKCKNLEVYKGDYNLYSSMSKEFIKIIKKYTPDVEQVSVDECFVDYGPVRKIYGDVYEFSKKLQKEIFDTLGFTVNIGIANNKLCAKMASDFSKPSKIHTLYNDEIKEKMWPLKVDDLFGIGKKSSELLHKLNINTIEELAKSDINYLYKYFKNMAVNMIDSANGIDESIVDSSLYIPKGIGNEITLETDIYNEEDLYPHLLTLSESVSMRLRKLNKYAKTVVVTIKDIKFKRKSHQTKLLNETNDASEIYKTSKKILREMEIDGVRLIGIRLDDLTDSKIRQISIFDNSGEYKKEDDNLNKVVDKLKEKYGNKIIKKASILNNKNK